MYKSIQAKKARTSGEPIRFDRVRLLTTIERNAKMNRRIASLIIGLLLTAGGCATTRGVVDLPTPSASTPSSEIAADALPVFISNIDDQRVFELKPSDPSTPSLKDGQIENEELKSRAIARKRNTFGMAMGDVMLPEGKTVNQVVEENLKITLEENGYRVVNQPGEGVTELNVKIHKFWSWFTPGFWALKIEFQSELELDGTLPGLKSGTKVTGYAHQKHQAATGGAWVQTMQVGMDDMRSNLSNVLEVSE